MWKKDQEVTRRRRKTRVRRIVWVMRVERGTIKENKS